MRARSLILARRRDERGVYAILFALMSVMLLTLAALGTDLGNTISRHTDAQNQADFAAYSVGVEHPSDIAAGVSGSTPSIAIQQEVADYLNDNQPQDDDSPCWRHAGGAECVDLAAHPNQLVDGNAANGEVRFVAKGRLQVVAPTARVAFGFANVFGTSGANVQASATVGVFTAGPRVLPMFAVKSPTQDCASGLQTLTSPPTAEALIPDLEFPGASGPARPNPPTVYDSTNHVVTNLSVGGGPYTLVIDANQWQKTWKLGFFRETGTPRTIVVQGTDIRSAADTTLPAGPPLISLTGTTAVNVVIPPEVYAADGVWWIRAWGGKNTIADPANDWSPVSTPSGYRAPSIQVGTPVLQCDAGPSVGNFGTIKLPREIPYNANDLPANIATGLVDGLNLVVHEEADSTGLCENGVNGAVESDTAIRPNTNCIDTDTGLPANVATEGLITYDHGNGLLAGKDTHPGCDPHGGSAERPVDVVGGPGTDYYINDDVLSCFLLSGKTLGEVVNQSYAGGVAFDKAVFDSPRFAWVPVFGVRPTGGAHTYSIVDFRPAFITDQDPSCSAPGYCVTNDNGITLDSRGIVQVKVVFFSEKALPHDGDIPLIDYLGIGAPIVHLVD